MAVSRIRGAFTVPKKGETFELRAGLVSQYAYERKESIQKTIQAMTLGKDVSALFPDVLKNIATGDLDQKKLVYLYLMFVFTPSGSSACSTCCTGGMLTARPSRWLPGTMPSHTPTYASSPSTRSSKTLKIQTPL